MGKTTGFPGIKIAAIRQCSTYHTQEGLKMITYLLCSFPEQWLNQDFFARLWEISKAITNEGMMGTLKMQTKGSRWEWDLVLCVCLCFTLSCSRNSQQYHRMSLICLIHRRVRSLERARDTYHTYAGKKGCHRQLQGSFYIWYNYENWVF